MFDSMLIADKISMIIGDECSYGMNDIEKVKCVDALCK